MKYFIGLFVLLLLVKNVYIEAKKIRRRKPKPLGINNIDTASDGMTSSLNHQNRHNHHPPTCGAPCRVCAPWENDCLLREMWTVEAANEYGIYSWQNEITGHVVFRNRSYVSNPHPYSPRPAKSVTSLAEEFWITELMFTVLKHSESTEHQLLSRILKEQDPNNSFDIEDPNLADHVFGSEIHRTWQDGAKKFDKEKPSLIAFMNSPDWENNCSSSTCKNKALDLFNSDIRSSAIAALRHERFQIFSSVYFINIFNVYIELMAAVHKAVLPASISTDLTHYSETDRCAVVLDNREHYSLIVSIRHTMHVLGPGWSLVVFHTAENEAYLRLHLKEYTNVEYRRIQSLSWEKASALKASSVFYKALPSSCRHVMIFEDDAILRDGFRMPEYLAYAHAGAPWRWCAEQWCRYGGNGGASLRRKDVMLDVIQEISCTNFSCKALDLYRETEVTVGDKFNTEDVFLAARFFARRDQYEDFMPTFATQQSFSVETMYYENPVWLHKPWPYMHPINVIELMAKAFTHYNIWTDMFRKSS